MDEMNEEESEMSPCLLSLEHENNHLLRGERLEGLSLNFMH